MLSSDPIQSLESAAAAIVQRQGGTWRRGGAMCRCPAHPDTSPSLSVRVGETSILFRCFAGCDTADVLRALRRIQMQIPVRDERLDRPYARCPTDHGPRARELWDAASPLVAGQGDAYLRRRGIGEQSPALRYHPAVPLGRGRTVCFRPALVAAITQQDRIVAIQRTFLERGRPELARDLANPRRMLGRPLRGAVALSAAGACLGLAEGIETAMSASILLGIPVWATLGSERLPAIDIPAPVERLILLPDADRAGLRASRVARLLYEALGLGVEIRWPWNGLRDWNDVLREKGRRREIRCGWPLEGQAAPHSETDHDPAYR